MYAALLKLIPFRDYLYAALAVAAVIWFLHHDHLERDIGAAKVVASVQAATRKAEQAAQKRIDKLNVDHANDVAQIEDRYENTIHDNDVAHAADLQRLHERSHSDSSPGKLLGSASGGETSTQAGASSAEGLGGVPATIALRLADALRADDAALDKCYADRDSLTGK